MDKFFLVLLHPLSNNIDVTKHFNYEPRFNGVFSRNNLPRTKDGAYVINFNDKCSIVNLNDFIESMLARRTLLDHTNLSSWNDYKKDDKMI